MKKDKHLESRPPELDVDNVNEGRRMKLMKPETIVILILVAQGAPSLASRTLLRHDRRHLRSSGLWRLALSPTGTIADWPADFILPDRHC